MKTYLFLLALCATHLVATDDLFKTSFVNYGCWSAEAKIALEHDNQTIGYIYYTQLPCKIYVVHSFFVFNQFRKQGNGKKLLEYVMKTLKTAGARLVFVQPGPFELKDQHYTNLPAGPERTQSIKRLVKIYQSNGFQFAPRILSWGAWLAYKVARIDENPRYLMFKK